MDYATMRDLFFAAPSQERPQARAATGASPARALRDAFEPLASQAIWSAESADGYRELGLDDFFVAYVRQRTAPLGEPAAPVAVTAMGVFAYDLIAPQYEAGIAAISRADAVRVRTNAPGPTLRRVLAGEPDLDARAAAVLAALRRGLDAADATSRPLFTGLRAEPWPADVLAALVHACNQLREHRGDSHLAVCAVAGLDPVEMNILTELYCGYPILEYTATRGWSPEQMEAAVGRLRARGLVDGSGAMTAAGVDFRHGLEEQTDAMQQSIVDAIGDDIGVVTAELNRWSDALVAGGAAPVDPAKRLAG
ncbi:hypothetical protein PSU4_20710 [Pseudonocardia sulfidoxydans NBRC 16205]|uniref:SalK n=1 Tax=Pseudonocardia sulfidoxydans NBRC 16205 TaxID=1223511 RepID=A0A511DEZ7_9PSEU|nr:hypothetical protein [Pseudonocardia sulfidoxydans]GEL23117.1 hypothetical protein PSU4_20710 [Pseudonocardia sulfidoxydans NBRC 16205]